MHMIEWFRSACLMNEKKYHANVFQQPLKIVKGRKSAGVEKMDIWILTNFSNFSHFNNLFTSKRVVCSQTLYAVRKMTLQFWIAWKVISPSPQI